ncbi:hypothetical protein GCM10028777_03890 [Angustibacter speluncae]
MFLDDRMMAHQHRDDLTTAASTRLVRALRGSARARRRHLAADRGHLPLAGDHLQRAIVAR